MKYVYLNLELGIKNADVCDVCKFLNDDPKTLQELKERFPERDLKSELKTLRKARLIDLVPVITPEEAKKYAKTK